MLDFRGATLANPLMTDASTRPSKPRRRWFQFSLYTADRGHAGRRLAGGPASVFRAVPAVAEDDRYHQGVGRQAYDGVGRTGVDARLVWGRQLSEHHASRRGAVFRNAPVNQRIQILDDQSQYRKLMWTTIDYWRVGKK